MEKDRRPRRAGNPGPFAATVRRAPFGALAAGLALVLVTACARTSVQDVQVMATWLPRPNVVLVYPFAASGGAVTLSGGLLSRTMEAVENTPEAQ